jgi:hypothetical protein
VYSRVHAAPICNACWSRAIAVPWLPALPTTTDASFLAIASCSDQLVRRSFNEGTNVAVAVVALVLIDQPLVDAQDRTSSVPRPAASSGDTSFDLQSPPPRMSSVVGGRFPAQRCIKHRPDQSTSAGVLRKRNGWWRTAFTTCESAEGFVNHADLSGVLANISTCDDQRIAFSAADLINRAVDTAKRVPRRTLLRRLLQCLLGPTESSGQVRCLAALTIRGPTSSASWKADMVWPALARQRAM